MSTIERVYLKEVVHPLCLVRTYGRTRVSVVWSTVQSAYRRCSILCIMRVYAVRLRPGTEVTEALKRMAVEELPLGGCVLSCVGSVTEIILRFAAQHTEGGNQVSRRPFWEQVKTLKGHYEVLSLVGTITKDGLHLHTCLGDAEGNTVGGHVMGNMVTFTTMELVIGVMEQYSFTREMDQETGFDELVVTPVTKS
ncbi:PPC domain [Trinorchestia longiramus]|nr:PPC domain [Trinorchestia longiramus]